MENKTYSSTLTLNNKSNVVISGCKFLNTHGVGIQLNNCSNITIQNCLFDQVISGIYAVGSKNITIKHCTCTRIQGPVPRGQFVQFNGCSGTNLIAYNVVDARNYGKPEDLINMFKSSGTTIEYNYLRGCGNLSNASNTGSGIMLGDYGGTNLVAQSNILLDTGHQGIGCAGGSNISIINNQMYSQKNAVSTTGLCVFAYKNTPPDHVVVENNKVGWINKNGHESCWWKGAGVTHLTLSGNVMNLPYPNPIPTIPSGWGSSLTL